MKAAEKAYYNLMFAVDKGEELKPISKVTKKKVAEMIDEKMKIIEYNRLHHMGWTEEMYQKEKRRHEQMKALLEA